MKVAQSAAADWATFIKSLRDQQNPSFPHALMLTRMGSGLAAARRPETIQRAPEESSPRIQSDISSGEIRCHREQRNGELRSRPG